MSKPRNPKGWHTLPIEVITDGTQIIFVGEPPDESEDPDSVAHHCDSMGCRWCHVLVRFTMEAEQRLGLWHLIKAGMDRAKLADAPKPLSLREQVMARIGRRPPEKNAFRVPLD